MSPDPKLAVVIVTHGHAETIVRTLAPVAAGARDGDELIVVDNASADGTLDIVRAVPEVRVVETGRNAGFPEACNRGAEATTADLLVFLNPDAVVQPGWREAIAAPAAEHPEWGAWQALVTADNGEIVNTSGGVVHFTGIAWAGGAGDHVPGDAELAAQPGPGFASGACLAIRRSDFERLGGFAGDFFLYHEDVDISLRVRLAGLEIGLARAAVVDHDYDFDKGPGKWRMLERNRWATLIRTYPTALLALLLPALAATELALIPVAIAGGWFRQKALAWGDVASSLPRLIRERRMIQATRRVSAAEFARGLTPDLDSPYLGRASSSGLLRFLLRAYWRVVLALLGERG